MEDWCVVGDRHGEFAFGLLRGRVDGATRIRFEKTARTAACVSMIVTSTSEWKSTVRSVAFDFSPLSPDAQEVSTCVEVDGKHPPGTMYIHRHASMRAPVAIDRRFTSHGKAALLQAFDKRFTLGKAPLFSRLFPSAAVAPTSEETSSVRVKPRVALSRHGAYLITLGVSHAPVVLLRELNASGVREAAYIAREADARRQLGAWVEDRVLMEATERTTTAAVSTIFRNMKTLVERELALSVVVAPTSTPSAPPYADAVHTGPNWCPGDDGDGSSTDSSLDSFGCAPPFAPKDFYASRERRVALQKLFAQMDRRALKGKRAKRRGILTDTPVVSASETVEESTNKYYTKLWVSVEFLYEDDEDAMLPGTPYPVVTREGRDVLFGELHARATCLATEAFLQAKELDVRQAVDDAWASATSDFERFIRDYMSYTRTCDSNKRLETYGLAKCITSLSPSPPRLSFTGPFTAAHAVVLKSVRGNALLQRLLDAYTDEDVKNVLLFGSKTSECK
jgi:hypothetical protein